MLVIHAEPIKGKDLKPGDLFSMLGPEFWSDINAYCSRGVKVYIRTYTPYYIPDDEGTIVYKITVEVK